MADLYTNCERAENPTRQENTASGSQSTSIFMPRVPMFSCGKTEEQSLGTWTFPKFRKKGFAKLRQGHLTTLVLKSGKMSPMDPSPISGHWDVSCTKWWPYALPFKQTIWKASIRRSLRENILNYLWDTPPIWMTSSESFCRQIPSKGHLAVIVSRLRKDLGHENDRKKIPWRKSKKHSWKPWVFENHPNA